MNSLDKLEDCTRICGFCMREDGEHKDGCPGDVKSHPHSAGDYDRVQRELKELKFKYEALSSSVFEYECDEQGHRSVFDTVKELREQLAAANKRIEEAEKQEPAGSLGWNGTVMMYAHNHAAVRKLPNGKHQLYAKPIPPADVSELQKQVAMLTRKTTDLQEIVDAYNHHKMCKFEELQAKLDAAIDTLAERDDKEARLERKLAEQQAYINKIQRCADCYVHLMQLDSQEELNKLLSQEREKIAKLNIEEPTV